MKCAHGHEEPLTSPIALVASPYMRISSCERKQLSCATYRRCPWIDEMPSGWRYYGERVMPSHVATGCFALAGTVSYGHLHAVP